MKTLYLMCGLPFSGKTTAASFVSEVTGALLVSLDQINAQHGLQHGGNGRISREEWAATHRIALARVEAEMEKGKTIVVDDTNCYRFLRQNFRRIAGIYRYRTIILRSHVSFQEIQKRIGENERSQARENVTAAVLEDLLRNFEWPSEEEETIVFSSLQQLCKLLQT